jgi:hypothetical protein
MRKASRLTDGSIDAKINVETPTQLYLYSSRVELSVSVYCPFTSIILIPQPLLPYTTDGPRHLFRSESLTHHVGTSVIFATPRPYRQNISTSTPLEIHPTHVDRCTDPFIDLNRDTITPWLHLCMMAA